MSYFFQKIEKAPTPSKPVPTFSPPSGPLSSTKPTSSSDHNGGMIAGSVVGGAMGLGIVALLAFILLPRRQKDNQQAQSEEIPEKTPSNAPVEGQAPPVEVDASICSTPMPEKRKDMEVSKVDGPDQRELAGDFEPREMDASGRRGVKGEGGFF